MKPTRFLAVASLAALPVLSLACAPELPNAADDSEQSGNALSASKNAYVTLKKDQRKCAAPMCGGWYATNVNKSGATPVYVASLDFSQSGLDDATAGLVTSATDGEVVVYGKLEAGMHSTHNLLASAAYRGMPDLTPGASDVYYTVGTRSPQIECFTTPCPNLTAHKLNSSAKTNYATTDINLGHFLQVDWLTESVEDDGAIVVGSIANETLTASQVFLKLPNTVGPCPELPVKACAAGEVQTFIRTPDLCLVPQGCVAQHPCPLFLPYCGADYQAESWVRENGCNMINCDPAWLHQ